MTTDSTVINLLNNNITDSLIAKFEEDILYNCMSYECLQRLIPHINYKNEVHKGILLSFVSEYHHSLIEPLYPLQFSPYKDEIYEIEEKKIDSIIRMLDLSNN